MAYLEVGEGPPLVCVHGALGDFRTWSAVLGPLSKKHRVIAVSLRHFFPEHWDGVGDTYSIAQHVADVIAFIEKLDAGPVDLMGHSRGGHISFRAAQRRPDLLRKLVLVEPGGDVDASLDLAAKPGPSQFTGGFAAAADENFGRRYRRRDEILLRHRRGRRRLGAAARGAETTTARQRLLPWSVRSATSGRPIPGSMPSRSGCRRCSSAAPIPRGCCLWCCTRWQHMFRVQRRR